MRIDTGFLAAVLVACFLFAACSSTQDKPAAKLVRHDIQADDIDTSYYHYIKSQLYLKRGNIDKAIHHLYQASQLDTDSLLLKVELAKFYLQQKKTGNALALLQSVLEAEPNHLEALILSGNIYQTQQQFDQAKSAYKSVIAIAPDQERVYLLLGGIYMDTGETDSALEIYEQLVAHSPESFAGHFFIGKLYKEKGMPEAAEREFEKALILEPELEEARFELIDIYKKQNKPDRIIEIYQEIIQQNPQNTQATMELGYFYLQQGQADEGDRLLMQLGLKSRQDADVMRKIIQFYIDPKKYEAAIVIMKSMLKSVPHSSDIHYLTGVAYDGLKEKETAIHHFKMVKPGSRFYENAVVQTSVLYQEQGKTNEAIDYIKGVIEQAPKNPEFMLYLGSFYEELKAFEDAEAILKQGLDIDPNHIRLHFRLGVVYDKWGNKDKSIEQMQTVIRLDPQNANALNYLGYTYADMGENLDEAERLIKEALKYKPDDGYITDSLGWVYYKKGRFREALKYLEKAVDLTKDDPIILEHLGDAYRKLKDPENALKYYRRSLMKKTEGKEALEKKISDLLKEKNLN
jgi:tetratricopeptide (TPR) repeat protein